MRSLWLLLVLLLPLRAVGQQLLHFQCEVSFHDTGTSGGSSKWHPDDSYGGPEARDFIVTYNDTISITPDSISTAINDVPQSYHSQFTGRFNQQTNTIYQLQIVGYGSYRPSRDGETYKFKLWIDSLPLETSSATMLSIAKGTYQFHPTSSYSYSHPGPSQSNASPDMTYTWGEGSDSGIVIVGVPDLKSEVRMQSTEHSIRITSFGTRAIQIKINQEIAPTQAIHVYDYLGRLVYQGYPDGNIIKLTNLCSGCYMARIGTDCVKFIVK